MPLRYADSAEHCSLHVFYNDTCERCYELEHGKEPRRKMTRNERLQEAADRGCDTWEEYRGER